VETRGLSFYIFQDSGYERKWYFHIVKFPGMKILENSLKENLHGLVLYCCYGDSCSGFLYYWKIARSQFLSANTIGSLRVDRSDEDGPLVFMEVDPRFRDFAEMDVVILKVKHEDFIPRK